MSVTYSCPHCQAVLNPEHAIVLVANRAGQRLLIGLHPEPGNYQLYVGPGLAIEPGTLWDFACPACAADLRADGPGNEQLCALDMAAERARHKVFFSRIAGERATYVVNSQGQREAHGEAAERYQHLQLKYLV